MIYLASPYTHPDPKVRALRAQLAGIYAGKLTGMGRPTFSPVAYGALLSQYFELPGDFEYWRTFNDKMIAAADEMIVLQLAGWELSQGIAHEIAVAKGHQISLRYTEFTF